MSKKLDGCGFEIVVSGKPDEATVLVAESKDVATAWFSAITAQQNKVLGRSPEPSAVAATPAPAPAPAPAAAVPVPAPAPAPVEAAPVSAPVAVSVSAPAPAPVAAPEKASVPSADAPPAGTGVAASVSQPATQKQVAPVQRESPAGGAAEEEEEDKPKGDVYEESTSQYDCVCCIDSIEQVCDTESGPAEGWMMKFAPGMRQQFAEGSANWNSSVVAVLGLYNKGKTFVLNSLTQLELDSGTTVHTEGLSFKMIRNKRVNHILLDTAGLHSPVFVKDEHPEKALAVKKATEFFLEDLSFLLADFFVVVVQDLTSLDQEYIQKLVLKLQHDPEKVQQLYIVHNFRDARTQDVLTQLWTEQVTDIYRSGETVTTMVSARNPASGALEHKEVDWLNTPHTRHVYVANADCSVGRTRNPWVFALLKMWLGARFVPVKRIFSPVSRLLDYSNKMIQYYVENSTKLEFDEKRSLIGMSGSLDEGKRRPSLKPATIDVNGFCFVDVDYVPRVDSFMDEHGLRILMDVPGLTGPYKITKVGWDTIRVAGVREKPYGDPNVLDKCERKYGAFKKEFKIPPGFQIRGAKHGYDDGVVWVQLARSSVEEEL